MKKSIIISIKPEWVEKILNGEKTIEIRKSIPKCDLPIDVYIYCTKGSANLYKEKLNRRYYETTETGFSEIFTNILNGKIVAKFTLNKIDYTSVTVKYGQNITHEYFKDIDIYVPFEEILPKTCLSEQELVSYEYTNHRFGVFAWHIDNLEIFDKPMELSEFYRNVDDFVDARPCNCGKSCKYEGYDLQEHQSICEIDYDGESCPFVKIQKAPQSWCYCYKGEE